MTKDELLKLVESGDCDALAAALKDLTESERRKLAKAAVEIAENMQQPSGVFKNLVRARNFEQIVECAGWPFWVCLRRFVT